MVLAAALDVLIKGGYTNFSVSGVATRAGVSRGALERLPTKNDLLVGATQHAMNAAINHAGRLAAGGGQRTVAQFLRDSEHFFFGPLYRAMLELAIAASASDRALAKLHRPIVTRARSRLNRVWSELVPADAASVGHPGIMTLSTLAEGRDLMRPRGDASDGAGNVPDRALSSQ